MIAVVYIEIRVGLLRKYFNVSLKSSGMTRDLLRYVLPLLPSVMCWWLTTSSDRFLYSTTSHCLTTEFMLLHHVLAV